MGETGLQMFCPYITNVSFMRNQCLLGTSFIRACSVSSGVFVSTSPSRFDMRCTCMSTGIAGFSNAYTSTQLAVLRPTPGIPTSLSMSSGTTPPYSESTIFATSTILLALTR